MSGVTGNLDSSPLGPQHAEEQPGPALVGREPCSPSRSAPRVKSWYDPPVLFAMGCASAAVVAGYYGTKGLGLGYETINVAKNLVREGSFANPFTVLATGPTAHVAPLYALLLAGLLKLTGGVAVFEWLANRLMIGIHGLAIALLVNVSRRFWGTANPGLYGALSAIFLPIFLVRSGEEAMIAALGLMVFCLCCQSLLRTPGHETGKGIAIGFLAGLIVLLNPSCVIPVSLWVAFLVRLRTPSAFRFAGAAAAVCVLTCLPWVVRCYRQFGELIPIRDNFGFELYLSNNDCAETTLLRNNENGCYALTHPNVNLAEARLVRSMGEMSYYHYKGDAAETWIKSHPRRFLALTAGRVLHFWYPDPDVQGERLPVYSIWLVTTISLCGLALLAVHREPMWWFIALVFLLYPLPYYLVPSSVRYFYPIFWLNLLCAGYFIDAALTYFRERGKVLLPAAPPVRNL